METDVYFVLIAQLGHPAGERWRVHAVELDRVAAETRARTAERAEVWVHGRNLTETVITLTKVVTRDELAGMVGKAQARHVEASLKQEIKAKTRARKKKKKQKSGRH